MRGNKKLKMPEPRDAASPPSLHHFPNISDLVSAAPGPPAKNKGMRKRRGGWEGRKKKNKNNILKNNNNNQTTKKKKKSQPSPPLPEPGSPLTGRRWVLRRGEERGYELPMPADPRRGGDRRCPAARRPLAAPAARGGGCSALAPSPLYTGWSRSPPAAPQRHVRAGPGSPQRRRRYRVCRGGAVLGARLVGEGWGGVEGWGGAVPPGRVGTCWQRGVTGTVSGGPQPC